LSRGVCIVCSLLCAPAWAGGRVVFPAPKAGEGPGEKPALVASVPGTSESAERGTVVLTERAASAGRSEPRAEQRAQPRYEPRLAPPQPELPEPTLAQAMEAAARLAAGSSEDDDSRLSRARNAHWAPQLRAQAGRSDSEAVRTGQQSSAPLHWDQQAEVNTWQLAATWDLSQLVYDRDEGQLALGRSHLARRRQEAAGEVAERYVERQRLRRAVADSNGRDAAAALLLLRCTAALEALTGGLFAAQLAQAQALAVPSSGSGPFFDPALARPASSPEPR
jgi:hypothetical protein